MTLLFFIKSLLTALLRAVGELFAWLNRRDDRKEDDERKARLRDNLSAAARPTPESADRLNRWLAEGRTGRLRPPGPRPRTHRTPPPDMRPADPPNPDGLRGGA